MAAATVGTQLIRRSRPEGFVVRQSEGPGTAIELASGKLWRAEGNHCWRAIVCLEGLIWITQESDLHDHLIAAGEMFLISQPGKVIVQALFDSRIDITPCLATPAFRGRFQDTIWP